MLSNYSPVDDLLRKKYTAAATSTSTATAHAHVHKALYSWFDNTQILPVLPILDNLMEVSKEQ